MPQTTSETSIQILGIAGSLRRESYSVAILKTLGESLGAGVSFQVHDLAAVPLYNQDDDGEHSPASVKELRRAIADASGLVIVTPEFNYGMPGVLKNALDWASRPAYASVLKGKPVAIITSSPGALGGVRAQDQVRQTLFGTLSRVVVGPEVVITHVGSKIANGALVDEASLRFATEHVQALLQEVRRNG